PDGKETPIEDSAAPITDEAGNISGVVLIFRDVSERKLRDASQRFLAQASDVLNSTLDYDLTFQNLAELAVPSLADWCAIDLLDDSGRLYEIALTGPDLASQRAVHDLRMKLLEADPQLIFGSSVIKSGEAMLFPDV